MLYVITRWKSFEQGLVSLCKRRTFTKRPAKVDIKVPIKDQNELAFRHFTGYPSIDRKKMKTFGYHLKNQKSNLLLVSTRNASKICQRMEVLETAEDMEICTSLPSNSFQPMTEMIDLEHDPITEDCCSKMTKPALIEKVDPIEIIVAMFNGLTLDDKRKIKESDREHFETFQSHRPYARPCVKRIKMSNN